MALTRWNVVLLTAPTEVKVPVRRKETASAAILAFTNDPEVRDLLFELAVAEGFGVRCTESEAEAKEILALEPPGLFLVDLDMRDGAGSKFLRALRQGPMGDIPSIAVTASNDPMLAVSVDTSIFFKPELAGIDDALRRLFGTDA